MDVGSVLSGFWDFYWVPDVDYIGLESHVIKGKSISSGGNLLD